MSLQERFSTKWIPVPESGCWLWEGSVCMGYGKIGADGTGKAPLLAHRVSYELHVGKIPEGLQVLHRCDVKCCVNPNHLFIGTQQDNVRDCFEKGRAWMQQRPQDHPNALKTVCKYGHAFTPENTYIRNNGSRQCIACMPRLNKIRNERRK